MSGECVVTADEEEEEDVTDDADDDAIRTVRNFLLVETLPFLRDCLEGDPSG
jgi:hypothetical protein